MLALFVRAEEEWSSFPFLFCVFMNGLELEFFSLVRWIAGLADKGNED